MSKAKKSPQKSAKPIPKSTVKKAGAPKAAKEKPAPVDTGAGYETSEAARLRLIEEGKKPQPE